MVSTNKKSAVVQENEEVLERTMVEYAIEPRKVFHRIAVEGLRATSIVDYGQGSRAGR